jgi:ABC-2 type transport system ATP-binding protein
MMTDTTLALNALHKKFDNVSVLKDISVTVHPGEVIGLLGLNGAGKTTLLETTLGFSPPNSGEALVFGQNSLRMDNQTKARIGFVPQRDELLEAMKGDEYLKLIAAFYANWNNALVSRLATSWDVPLNMKIAKMSIGQRQKLSIISALGHEPDLIILDEPVASLDPLARRLFLKELVDIAALQTRTIVFSTHIVTDLERVASRVWLMKAGNIEIDAAMDELKEGYVRVAMPAGTRLPSSLQGYLLHQRNEQGQEMMLFKDWSSALHQQLTVIARVPLQAETLALEELFLEMHA